MKGMTRALSWKPGESPGDDSVQSESQCEKLKEFITAEMPVCWRMMIPSEKALLRSPTKTYLLCKVVAVMPWWKFMLCCA